MKVKPSLQALKLSPLFGQTLIGSRPYLTLSGFTLLLKFLARLMPLPSLKLRLLNKKLAGNAHFELALADVPADLDFTNSTNIFYLSIQSMALFLSLLSFCGWIESSREKDFSWLTLSKKYLQMSPFFVSLDFFFS